MIFSDLYVAKVEVQLGEGSFGVVYRARCKGDGRNAAWRFVVAEQRSERLGIQISGKTCSA